MRKSRTIEFKEQGDERGYLVIAEGAGRDIPFDIKRVFYIYGTGKGVVRGNHANRNTEFVLINVSGTSKVRVDDGIHSEEITLTKPRMGVYIPAMIWKEMYDFSPDSVLLVLASEHYDETEYIRDYDEFLREVLHK